MSPTRAQRTRSIRPTAPVLRKWTLSDGTWSLDYALQASLIGVPIMLPGWDFGETTIGLRSLTGEVNASRTVAFFATASTSGDFQETIGRPTGEIVKITATSPELDASLPMTNAFSVFDGPRAGLRYRRSRPRRRARPSTWAMLLLGFGGLGFVGCPKRSRSVAQLITLAKSIKEVASWRFPPNSKGVAPEAAGAAPGVAFRRPARSRPAKFGPRGVIVSAETTPARRACKSHARREDGLADVAVARIPSPFRGEGGPAIGRLKGHTSQSRMKLRPTG